MSHISCFRGDNPSPQGCKAQLGFCAQIAGSKRTPKQDGPYPQCGLMVAGARQWRILGRRSQSGEPAQYARDDLRPLVAFQMSGDPPERIARLGTASRVLTGCE